MTELTPLARKLQIAYLNPAITDSDDTEAWAKVEVRWNAAAKAAEDELVTPHPVRLPTVEECHRAIGASCANALVDPASVVLDLVASLNPTWVPVLAATIPADTRVRVEGPGTVWATEFEWRPKDQVFAEGRATGNFAYFVPSGTVLTTPIDPRIEAAAKAIAKSDCDDGGAGWDGLSTAERDIYVAFAKAAADALGVAL